MSLKTYLCYGNLAITILISHLLNQERMLKKGFAWHYTAYDQRSELARVSNMLSLLNFVLQFYEASLF